MPPVIGAAILGAVGAGSLAGTAVLGTDLATVVGTLALTGATIGAQALVNAIQSTQAQQATVNQAMAPRQRIYGRAMVSGVRAFFDARNGNLYQIIMLASDHIDGYEQFFIGDIGVAVNSAGQVTSAPWSTTSGSHIVFELNFGDPAQAASPMISGAFPDAWGPAYTLSNIAYVAVVFTGVKTADFSKVYPQSYATQLRFVVRGAKVYDPRNGGMNPADKTTWAWSENSGLAILDYLTHGDGLRLPLSSIDLPSFESFANLCDEQVPLNAGGTENRYRIGGVYNMSELPKDVLQRMCNTCDGQLVQLASGKVGIRGGQWSAPSVSVTSAHTLSAQWQQGNGAFDAFNRLTASFVYPLSWWQMTEIKPLDDTASQAAIGTIPQALQLPMVTSYTQAARLAKIALAKGNPLWKGQLTVDATGLDAIGEVTLNVEHTPVPNAAPLVNGTFLLTSLSIKPDLSTVDLGVSYLTADAYSWNPATEEPPAPPTPQQIADYNLIAAPTNVQAVMEIQTISGGSRGLVGLLTWDPPTRGDAVPVAQYAVAGSGNWQPMTVNVSNTSATTPILQDGQSYDFQVNFSVGSVASAWTLISNVAASVPPSPPTNLTASRSGASVNLSALTPQSSNFSSLAFLRATTSNINVAAEVGSDIVCPANSYQSENDTLPGTGTYYYWAVSRTSGGTTSTAAGPVTVTY